jgi:hypothetical protein
MAANSAGSGEDGGKVAGHLERLERPCLKAAGMNLPAPPQSGGRRINRNRNLMVAEFASHLQYLPFTFRVTAIIRPVIAAILFDTKGYGRNLFGGKAVRCLHSR